MSTLARGRGTREKKCLKIKFCLDISYQLLIMILFLNPSKSSCKNKRIQFFQESKSMFEYYLKQLNCHKVLESNDTYFGVWG